MESSGARDRDGAIVAFVGGWECGGGWKDDGRAPGTNTAVRRRRVSGMQLSVVGGLSIQRPKEWRERSMGLQCHLGRAAMSQCRVEQLVEESWRE
jgi:hypothetical protein